MPRLRPNKSPVYFIVWVVTSVVILLGAPIDGSESRSSIPGCDPPAEVGKPYTFQHFFNKTYPDGIRFRWNNTRLGVRTLAFCYPQIESGNPRCLNYTERDYVASVHPLEGSEIKEGSSYRIDLTIKNVTFDRDNAEWIWSVGQKGMELGRCQLFFYSLPTVTITGCSHQPGLTRGYLRPDSVTSCLCDVTNLGLPPGKAYWMTPSGDQVISESDDIDQSATLNVTFDSQNPRPSYLCQGISTFGPGPNISYTPLFACKYGPPNVNISVENDTSSITLCPGASSTSSFSSSSSSSGLRLSTILVYCDVKKSLFFPDVNLTLVTSVTSQKQQQQQSQQLHEQYTLRLDENQDSEKNDTEGSNSTNYYERFVFRLELPEDGGVISLRCLAANSIYSDILATDETEIVVQAPPARSPRLSITNNVNNDRDLEEANNQINNLASVKDDNDDDFVAKHLVKDGQSMDLSCQIEGGYPDVINTTIQCLGYTMTSQSQFHNLTSGHESRLSLNASRNDTNVTCSCKANHVTGCYEATTQVTLDVQYPASILDFEVSTNTSALDIHAGMYVTLTCNVTGNPLPETITIARQPAGFLSTPDEGYLMVTEEGTDWRQVQATKVFECRDTGVYVCHTSNGIETGRVTRSMGLSVICPPELQDSFSMDDQPSFVTSGHRVYFDLPVIGHPMPYTFTLTQQSQCSINDTTLTFVALSPSLYTSVYLPATMPAGKVRVTFTPALSKQVGVYRLIVSNGIKPDLEYTFYLGHVHEKNEATAEDGDDDESLIIVVIVAVVVIVITNIAVGLICFSMGKKIQRKDEIRKREPKVQYVVSSPGYQNGGFQEAHESSPPSPGAYTSIDFVTLDDYRVADTTSTSDFDPQRVPQQREAARMPIPPPIPRSPAATAATKVPKVPTTTSSGAYSNSTTPVIQRPAHNNNNNNNYNNDNNNNNISPRLISAQAPPGNFYTYDLPKKGTNLTLAPPDTQPNNDNNPAIYANSDNEEDRRPKHDNKMKAPPIPSKVNRNSPGNKRHGSPHTIPQHTRVSPNDSNNSDYQEISPHLYYSESSENYAKSNPKFSKDNMPNYLNSKLAVNSDPSDNVYHQIPSNLEQIQKQRENPTLPGITVTQPHQPSPPISSVRVSADNQRVQNHQHYHQQHHHNDSKKIRNESDTSDDIYQQIDVQGESSPPNRPPSASPLTNGNNRHGPIKKANSDNRPKVPQRLNSRPIDLPLKYGSPDNENISFKTDNSKLSKHKNTACNNNNSLNNNTNHMSDDTVGDSTDNGNNPYTNDNPIPPRKGGNSENKNRKPSEGFNNNKQGNDDYKSGLGMGDSRSGDISPKYEDTKSLFGDAAAGAENGDENNKNNNGDAISISHSKPSRFHNIGRQESEYELCDTGVDIDENVNDNGVGEDNSIYKNTYPSVDEDDIGSNSGAEYYNNPNAPTHEHENHSGKHPAGFTSSHSPSPSGREGNSDSKHKDDSNKTVNKADSQDRITSHSQGKPPRTNNYEETVPLFSSVGASNRNNGRNSEDDGSKENRGINRIDSDANLSRQRNANNSPNNSDSCDAIHDAAEGEEYSHYVTSDSELLGKEGDNGKNADTRYPLTAPSSSSSSLSPPTQGYNGEYVGSGDDINHYVLPSPVRDDAAQLLSGSGNSGAIYENTNVSTLPRTNNTDNKQHTGSSNVPSVKNERNCDDVVMPKKDKKPKAGIYEQVDF